ncbi:MAG: type II toxin-antitoxin system RatA family toxin [Saccharospirillum sp.]
MTKIHRSAIVPHSVETLYGLINDVEAYPQFLDGVVAGRVLEASETEMVGQMVIRKAGIERTLTTRNRLEPPHRIELTLVDGPLKSLTGVWLLTPLGESGCKVTLDVRFQSSGKLAALAFGPVFRQLADQMVDAFVQRANRLAQE